MPDSATQVHVTRTYDASREQVFAALVDPDQVTQWWGPEHFAVPRDSVDIDLRVGGRYHLTMVDPSGREFPVRQEVVELDPPSLLVLLHEPVPEHGLLEEIVSRIELHEDDGATRVVVTGGPYPPEMGPNAEQGWAQQLEKLERLLSA